jgi:hypothetical protein
MYIPKADGLTFFIPIRMSKSVSTEINYEWVQMILRKNRNIVNNFFNSYNLEDTVCQSRDVNEEVQYAQVMKEWRPVPTDISGSAYTIVGFEVFTAVVMKSFIFWDVMPCNLLS